ncbi:hypothetical protein CE91St1_13690 [Parabacteroides goldsteinii]|uniref:HzsA-related protein n=1 Tax=Parabacteroides TaxID=375288 RepID=UPI001F2DD891|nr:MULTISPECIES: hypothetical protein [Parabacteroides]GKG72226.1 hypothetical protein CE91St1_13690 [Parabacteroides goldsteinii]GKG78676.1 hypothetical protein CE91St2_18680 [Parabacteroides goldsteinii]
MIKKYIIQFLLLVTPVAGIAQIASLSENVRSLLEKQEILYIERHQYLKDHHNTATLFQKGEINEEKFRSGAAMKAFDLKTNTSRILLETDSGVIRDPELSFDGSRIVFAYRKSKDDDYHIYEINVDGSGLKQLTFATGISDIDPLYLPDGRIVFSSTREPKFCMCNRHIMCNLFRMDADGANIVQIGKSTLFEGHPSLLNDGRIIYDRWEYVDRNFGDAQGLWTVNPDGTKHAIYYGNNMQSPGGIIDPRAIPGSDLLLCIFSSCHDRPVGALALIDRRKGVDGKSSVVDIWPSYSYDLIDKGNWDAFRKIDTRYEDPFPLTENLFLVSRFIRFDSENDSFINGSYKMGIALVDRNGKETLLIEGEKSLFDPMPIAPRYKPISIPENRNYKNENGFFYVQNVYAGTHMEGVSPGSVKYLRIVESPEKRTWTKEGWKGGGQQAPAVNWHSLENKRILGEVPVEEDGSAYIEVPSDRFVYFQLLDKDRKMIQSMRSGVTVQSGEVNGCIGCHEDRLSVPISTALPPQALRKKPISMNGWQGKTVLFSFMKEVQPLLDKHCVRCHDFDPENRDKLVLAADKNPYFNASYINLHHRGIVKLVGAGPANIQQAYSWGAHASKLSEIIESNHHNVKLSVDEKHIFYTWMDLNGVYYPVYESAYPDNPAGRSPLTNEELEELSRLTGVDFKKLGQWSRKLGPQISFDRPEVSPCLDSVKDNQEVYKQAISLIEQGKKRLQKTPRADMENFIPCEAHRLMLRKYAERLKIENNNRKAVCEAEKIYD